ncbi:MAG: hypothetical protein PVSMB5_25690 [Ktedonobacteraceae bacterium]
MPLQKKDASSQAYGEGGISDQDSLSLALIEHSLDAIVLVDDEQTITYASPAIEQVTGYTPEEVVGRSVASNVNPQDAQQVQHALTRLCARSGESATVYYRLCDKGGSWRWLEATYRNLRADARVGNTVGYVRASSESQQERHEREKRLQAEQRLQLLNDVSTLLIASPDHQITLQEVAQMLVPTQADYCRIALLDAQGQIKDIAINHNDPTKKGLVEALYEQYRDRDSSTHGLQKLLTNGQPELISVVDESVRAIEHDNPELANIVAQLGLRSYMGVPLIARGRTIGAITFSSVSPDRYYTQDDLTFAQEVARRIAQALDSAHLFQEAQAELAERKQIEQNLRFLAEASKVLASSLDYPTTLANVTRLAVPHIADWCTVDMQGKDGIERLAVAHIDPQKVAWARELNEAHPPDPASPYGVPNVIRTGVSEFYPDITDDLLVAVARDEEQLTLMRNIGFTSSMLVPLLMRGKAIGVITFVTAESGKHYSSADLSMAEELASRAALAIENARLYSEAQDAIRLRDEFIATASHELRTPLTSLKMYTQILCKQSKRQGEEGTTMTRSLMKMDAQISKLTALIEDLLNVSKLEHGKLAFHQEAFDLNEVVKETVEHIQPGTRHRIHVEGTLLEPVWGDKERIGQVLTNLLTNAVKYSPKADTIIVHIADEQGMATVGVQDFGIGIASEHLQYIFDRFYRVNDPEEKTYPGLGIGLHIAHEIVARHNGTMSVSSEKGNGSLFRFTLPYARSTSATRTVQSS